MIEQTLCQQLVNENRRLYRELTDERARAQKLQEQLDEARRRIRAASVEMNRLRNGRDLWRLRATRKAA